VRLNYSEDEDYPGQFELWQANCERSLRGKQGQEELRELRTALLALPEKRLILGALENADGDVCAIAAYGKHKGLNLADFKADPEFSDEDEDSDDVGIAGGMPRLVAWKVVAMNDIHLDRCTPEQRYERMLAWVESKIIKAAQ
jgi:hypothetical protein